MYKAVIDPDTHLAILEPRHAAELYTLIDSSREEIGQWLAFPAQTTKVADSSAFIERSLKRLADNNGYWAGIWHDGQLAGSIGFLYIDWEAGKTEIGYWLGKTFVGNGLATNACRRFIDHASAELGLRKVEMNAAPGNTKSTAIPERLGFTHEGTIRSYEYLNGAYLDRAVYGLLREEWRT